MGKIYRGRIVWLKNVIDMRGKPTQNHRAIIVTTEDDYKAGKPIQAVHISSKFDDTDDRIVVLKHAPGGHPQTGLDRPSAAICAWRNENVNENDITSYGNLIFGAVMIEVLEKIQKSTQD